MHLWVGGGIVWDSDPEAEIEESWVKARPLLAAVGAPVDGGAVAMSLLARRGRRARRRRSRRAGVHADDEALLRGRAAFETMRVYGGRPFRLAEHLARLAASAERLGLPAPNRAECAQLADAALAAAGAPDAVLRLYWTPGATAATPVALALVGELPA